MVEIEGTPPEAEGSAPASGRIGGGGPSRVWRRLGPLVPQGVKRGGPLLGALLVLSALDLARAQLGPAVRPWQWAAGLLAFVMLRFWQRARGVTLRQGLPALVLAALLLPTYVAHTQRLGSDGINYYAFLRSALFDHDLALTNDFRLLGSDYSSPDVLPVGAPILWSPLVLLVHLGWQATRLLGAPAPTGVEPIYQAAVCQATLLYAGAGLFLLLGVLRRFFSPSTALWTTVLCWVGSPLRFYLSVLPSLAHGTEFLAAVLVLRAYLTLRDRPDRRSAIWMGAACGLVFLVRSQDGILLGLPAIELGLRLWRGPDRRATLWLGGAVVVTFVLTALPQLLVWQHMFGTPFLVPHKVLHGEAFMHLAAPELLGTLFSPRGGLFASYPILVLAIAGLLGLALRPRRGPLESLGGAYTLAVLPVLAIGWYVNSTVFDWYQVRRFTGLVPLMAPGLGLVIAPLSRVGVVLPMLLAFTAWRYDLAVDRLRPQPGGPVPVRAALVELADGLAQEGYRLLEPGAPRAAVALLSTYTGESFLSETASSLDLSQDAPWLRLPKPARHLSAPEVEDGVACRWVEDHDMRLFLPLAYRGGLVVSVEARALETERPQAMQLLWNGHRLGREEMLPAWKVYRFHVPAELLTAGTNELALEFERRPIFRRVRGFGPRKVRPAALSRLTLHRDSG